MATQVLPAIAFQLLDAEFLMPSGPVTAILEAPTLQRVPRQRKDILGFFTHKSRIVPVVRIAPCSIEEIAAMIVVGGEFPVAIPVSKIHGVQDISLDSVVSSTTDFLWSNTEAWCEGKTLVILSPLLLSSFAWSFQEGNPQPTP